MDTNTHTLFLIGIYYYYNKKYDEMKKYYHMAINLGHSNSMYNLGNYYQNIEHNYEEMIKYYLMAINLNHYGSMNNLGLYYYYIKNYEEMKKYYHMAINLGNSSSMNNLGNHYQTIEQNYDEMNKYYYMAIKYGNNYAFNNLLDYYIEQQNDIFIHFMLYRLNYNNKFTINKYNTYDLTTYINTLNKLKKLLNTIKIQHFICTYKDNILYNPDYGLMIPLLQSKWCRYCKSTTI